jgi:Fur family transcriptional regulator, ferric uptake regulator
MQKEKEIFYGYLKKKGLKRTAQRDAILKMFLELEEHISPEELYRKLKKKHSHIGFSTVYRTLKLLSECGLAREMKSVEGAASFEHLYEHPHHDHLICAICGNISEFYNEQIEDLQERIAREYNFFMQSHRLEIIGLCSDCQKAEKKE